MAHLVLHICKADPMVDGEDDNHYIGIVIT